MSPRPRPLLALVGIVVGLSLLGAGPAVVRVGSKSFTESYILGEITAQIIEQTGEAQVERELGLGGTGITYRAVERGAIDIYPEYTGTLTQVLLKDPSLETIEAIRARLQEQGLNISDPLGFNNTYALAVRRGMAERLGLKTISDLQQHPELRGAFSSGFLERDDGWPGLRRYYGLTLADVRVMEHALTYQALANGKVDVIDIFSTDGQLEKLDLTILKDDWKFFPDYSGVLLVRQAFIDRHPRSWARLQQVLVNQLDNRRMSRLNALADLEGKSVRQVAARFLSQGRPEDDEREAFWAELVTLTADHLYLVALSLLVAVLVGLPLGIAAARFQKVGQVELMSIAMLQTIPALALLCFMIPLFGIGKIPALVALFLYALLPIVRNAYTGMISLDRQLLEIADVLGLTRAQRLVRVELPLASVSIMAGIKTSAVLTVGTATLAAFIGGGGYGTLIVRGLALDDISTILAGAVPAALMALSIHGLFEVFDRVVIPKGLRKEVARSL